MYLKISLLFLITAFVKADDVVLPYTTVAYTTSGAPCIGGCSPDTHQCVASWPVKTEPCVLHTKVAPIFRTTQTNHLYPYCLSNCGYYAWRTPWCFVTTDGEWDDCILLENQVGFSVEVLPYTTIAFTTTGQPCIGGCSPDTHQCVAHWPPKNEYCVQYGTPAPIAYTTQSKQTYSTCLSNCGSYAVKTPWCYVTKDGKWDYCTPQQSAVIVNPNTNNYANTKQNALVLYYDEVACTLSGAPCIGGCSKDTHQCVAGFPAKNEPCVRFGTPAPTSYTIQRYTKYSTCLSNCGAYAFNIPWCYVTEDGKWDFCTLQPSTSIINITTSIDITTNQNALVLSYDEEARTSSGAPCIGGCSPDTHQCVAGYPPKNEPCVTTDIFAPRFRATQSYSRHRYCISNCGHFAGRTFAWCYVTNDGQWDTCFQRQHQQDSSMQMATPKPLIFGTGQQQARNVQEHQDLPNNNQTNKPKPDNFDISYRTRQKQALNSDASTPKTLNLTSF